MCKGAINRHKTIMKACRQLKSTFTDHNQNKSRETVSLSPELACGVSYISKSLAVGSFDCQVDTTAKKGRHQRCTCSWMLQLENLLFTGWPILYLISCVMQIKGHRFPTKGHLPNSFSLESGIYRAGMGYRDAALDQWSQQVWGTVSMGAHYLSMLGILDFLELDGKLISLQSW